MQRKADSFALATGAGLWWDYWHYHSDWYGLGNRGLRSRTSHIRALCTVFEKICAAQDRFATPFQTWIVLDGEDASQDATYLHTPNPNGSAFPLLLTDIEWGTSAVAPLIRSLLPKLDIEVGWNRVLHEEKDGKSIWRTAHWIYANGIGAPLRAGQLGAATDKGARGGALQSR
jgi:hypothetical protein